MALGLQRSVKFDPVNVEFVNDDEPNRFCSYANRAPCWI
jgi:hypothetical protein